jgi:anti-sigma B factor antagonist
LGDGDGHTPSVRACLHPSTRGTRHGPPLGIRPGRVSLAITLEEHPDLTLVSLEGELDIYTVPAFRSGLAGHDPAASQLVIDLSAVTLIDSAGLGALISLRNRATRANRRIGLICPERLRRLFQITGLRRAFLLGDELAAARRALAQPPPTGA